MEKQWYVLHALSGQEAKARDNILKRIQLEEMQDYIGEVLIPTEKVAETKNGKKTVTTRKFFPGYILIEMALYDENRQLLPKPWAFMQETPGIIGFIGGDRPVALRPDEVASVQSQMTERTANVGTKVTFEPGESVRITDGAFIGMAGLVEEVSPERGKLKVSVSIFGRTASVEFEYWQVEKGE